MRDLAMTEARTGMLRSVRDGFVTYDGSSGRWCMSGETVAGWAGRTLSALRRNGYIELGGDAKEAGALYTVALTDKGKAALS